MNKNREDNGEMKTKEVLLVREESKERILEENPQRESKEFFEKRIQEGF